MGYFDNLFSKPARQGGETRQDPRFHSVSPSEFFADPAMWVRAPSTSHLWGWAYYAQGAESELRVRFKDKQTGGIGDTYYYRRVPQAVFDGFREATHPGAFGHRHIWYSYESGKV